MPFPLLPAGSLNENPTHRLGSRSEEVASAIPVNSLTAADQAQIRLVDQSCGLEGLAHFLLRQLGGGESSQCGGPSG